MKTTSVAGDAGQIEIKTFDSLTGTRRADLLFCHGAWSSSWYWETFFLPWFAERGFRCRALSLRGHGGSDGAVRFASINQYVEDLHVAAQGLDNPILIGHSMGGFITQRYLHKYPARAACLMASVPPGGAWDAVWRILTERPVALLRTIATLDLYGVVADPDTARGLLFSRDESRTDKDHLLPYLKSESFRGLIDMLLLPVRTPPASDTPISVIGAEFDQIIGKNKVQKTAKFYGTKATMMPMASHMLTVDDRWEDAALVLQNWILSEVLNETPAVPKFAQATAVPSRAENHDNRYPPHITKRAKMLGQMQYVPLTLSSILDYAEETFPEVPIWSREAPPEIGETGGIHRQNWAETAQRSKQLATVIKGWGIAEGDRVASLAWNTHRHLEIYYGATGIGAVLHTINPRLSLEHLKYMINFAEDKVVFYDGTFSGLIETLKPMCPCVRHWVQLSNAPQEPHWLDPAFDDLIAEAEPIQVWPELDEHGAAALCFTSGTTGLPKGVLYSHRALVLETMAAVGPNAIGVSRSDTVAPVVPMFHVNAWSLPFAAAMSGASLALPGASLGGEALHEFFEHTKTTLSAGVPTIWQALLTYAKQTDSRFSSMTRTVIGGSAVTESMIREFREEYGVDVIHGWGMTEMSPLGAINALTSQESTTMSTQEVARLLKRQGRAPFGVQLNIVDEDNATLPHDGEAAGHLKARGHWVIDSYFGHETQATEEGWFDTGDIATLSRDGVMTITDRDKDLIKSGGEWISSIMLEDIALGHDLVVEAAAIAVPHPKWDERPLVVCVSTTGVKDFGADVQSLFKMQHLPSWQIPDITFVDQLPLGATGKVLKSDLRKQFLRFHSDAET